MVESAARDDFDTGSALRATRDMARVLQQAVQGRPEEHGGPAVAMAGQAVAAFLDDMGLVSAATAATGSGGGTADSRTEAVVGVVVGFRDRVRAGAVAALRSGDAGSAAREELVRLLAVCDQVRDKV